MFTIARALLAASQVLQGFLKWAERMGYIQQGRLDQKATEQAELDRTAKVTDEEDSIAHTDTDADLSDELKRPL